MERMNESLDIDAMKFVLNETIGFSNVNEDPVLSLSSARGWYLMTRCTVHVCNSRDMFVEYTPMSGHEVILDNNNHVAVVGIGKVKLRLTTGKVLTLENVFHMPEIRKCCVSVMKLTENKFDICFNREGAVITKGQETVGEAYRESELFRLSIIEENIISDTETKNKTKKVVLDEIIGLIIVDEDPVLTLTRARGWYLMTRCSRHVCNSRDMFVKYMPLTNHEVIMENDDHVDVLGIGTVILRLTSGKVLTLTNVLHMPAIIKCYVSVGQLTKIGYGVTFRRTGAVIEEDDDVIIGRADREGDLYRLSIMEKHKGWVKVHNETIGLVDEDNNSNNSSSRDWYLNYRTSVSMCNSRDMFLDYHPVSGREVIMGNNGPVDVAGIGSVVLKFTTGIRLKLFNVFHVPTIGKCLLSQARLEKSGFSMYFGGKGVVIEKNDKIFGKGCNEGGLYRMSIVEGQPAGGRK